VLARAHQSLIWARNRHINALRNALREYYLAALVAFEDLAHGDALAVLDRAPTPEQGAHPPLGTIQSALKRGGRQRNIAARARQIQAALLSEQLVAPALVTAAFAATICDDADCGAGGGVAVDSAGDVYVTNVVNDRVVELAPGSRTQTVLPFTGLKDPEGVAVDTAGDVYVADSGNNRVLKLPVQ
jgi:hypothetical protein